MFNCLFRECSRLSRYLGSLALIASATVLAQAPSGNSATAFGLNVKNFGAVGDCHHDDTSALQAAVNQINGRTLLFPAGCYLISQPIKVPLAWGFRMMGEGRVGTKIQQETDNTPILVFTQELTHSWEVSDLEFSWSRNQPSQNTNADAIVFAAPGGNGGLFNFTISHVTFDNGFRGIYLAPGTKGSLPVWGFVLEDIIAARQMSGSTINLSPNPGVGMPRCVLRDIYSSQPSAEPQIKMNHCSSGTLDGIEDNNGVDTSLDLTSSDAMAIRGLHIELHHMAHAGKPVITAENSNLDFEGITADVWSEVPGHYYLVSNIAGGGSLSIRNVILRGTSPANDPPGFHNSPNAQTHLCRLNGPVKLSQVQSINLIHADINSSDDAATAAKISGLGKPVQ